MLTQATATLPATNLERARTFYRQRLGLRGEDYDPLGSFFFCEDGSKVWLYQRGEATKAEHTVAGWEVEDITKTVRELKDRGVEFERVNMPGFEVVEEGVLSSGPVKVSFFKDTEGNTLRLLQLG